MNKGIVCAGNIIVDLVKIINDWPDQGTLVSIEDVKIDGGGAPFNCLMNIAKIDHSIPLSVVGLVGDDHYGDWLRNKMNKAGIDTSSLQKTEKEATSYTDVMTIKNGQRTFFHLEGANRLLAANHFDSMKTIPKIFHLGYPTLLPGLDQKDDQFGTVAARLLHDMQKRGSKTSVDLVSVDSLHFKSVVETLLPHTNYLIINEIEAELATGIKTRGKSEVILFDNLQEAASQLMHKGSCELIIIHFPEGATGIMKNGQSSFQPSFKIAREEIQGTVGAGDTFCAGVLYCLHQNYHESQSLDYVLKFANACARFNLLSATSTGGTVPFAEISSYMETAAVNTFSF